MAIAVSARQGQIRLYRFDAMFLRPDVIDLKMQQDRRLWQAAVLATICRPFANIPD
jgi:hypothetical protein